MTKPDRLDELAPQRFNILIVDDDVQNQRMMELILKRTGHLVKFASNGVDAIGAAKSGGLDLVLMDIQMPLMDGLEATRRIREWENGEKHLVIVGLTAVLEVEHKHCIQAGMDGVISKPFEIDELYEKISAFMDQKPIAVKKTTSTVDHKPAKLPILDVQGSIKRFAGDRDNYATLLKEFILSLADKFEQLKADCETDDWEDLSDHAHNLKGLAANFGAVELSRRALELDQLVDEGLYGQTSQKVEEIAISIKALRTEAAAFLGTDPDGPGQLA